MQLALIVAISLHILAATFWAGSTFALARTGGYSSDRLFRPQLAAAAFTILAGGYLWRTLHEGAFGASEQLLGAGALSAVAALAIQIVVVGSALRQQRSEADGSRARSRVLIGQRAAALLLAIAAVTMAAARYA
jgi:uncharacterized membrane protein